VTRGAICLHEVGWGDVGALCMVDLAWRPTEPEAVHPDDRRDGPTVPRPIGRGVSSPPGCSAVSGPSDRVPATSRRRLPSPPTPLVVHADRRPSRSHQPMGAGSPGSPRRRTNRAPNDCLAVRGWWRDLQLYPAPLPFRL